MFATGHLVHADWRFIQVRHGFSVLLGQPAIAGGQTKQQESLCDIQKIDPRSINFVTPESHGHGFLLRVFLLHPRRTRHDKIDLVRSILSRHSLTDTSFFSECFYSIHGEPDMTKLVVIVISFCHPTIVDSVNTTQEPCLL